MTVYVGSDNPVKVRAVGRALDGRTDLPWKRDDIVAVAAESSVARQPSTVEETAEGAMHRVAWMMLNKSPLLADDPLYVGIESGIFRVGPTWLDFCVAHVRNYSGSSFSIGTSSGFELPDMVRRWLTPARIMEGKTLNHACKEMGLTEVDQLGHGIGLVGVLSDGRLSREDYTYEAVRNALFGIRAVVVR